MAAQAGLVGTPAKYLFARGRAPGYWAPKLSTAYHYKDWCARAGLDFAPADGAVLQRQLAEFVAFLWGDDALAGSTIDHYLSDVTQWLEWTTGRPVERGHILTLVMAGVKRATPAVRHAPAISAEQLRRVLAPLRMDVYDELVLRTALVCAWLGGWRVSRYSRAPTLRLTLRVGDMRLHPSAGDTEFAGFLPRADKGKPVGTEPPPPSWLERVPGSDLCPVLHVLRMMDMRPWAITSVDEPVFLMSGGLPLTAGEVRRFLKARQHVSGLPPDVPLVPHSTRVSGATAARMVGASDRAVHLIGGWRDPSCSGVMLATYLRDIRAQVTGLAARMLATTAAQFSDGDRIALHRAAPAGPPNLP